MFTATFCGRHNGKPRLLAGHPWKEPWEFLDVDEGRFLAGCSWAADLYRLAQQSTRVKSNIARARVILSGTLEDPGFCLL